MITMIVILIYSFIFIFTLALLVLCCLERRRKETINQRIKDIEKKIEDHVVELTEACSTRLISKF